MGKINLYGYCDESGNSGLNVFDENQPFFWVGTLLSRHDLDVTATSYINKLANLVGEKELHANILGLTKIDQIAKGLIDIIEKNNCFIIITKVEKRHVVKLKIFDYLFDSSTNKAVSHIHYGVRGLRLPLARFVCDNITLEMEKDFWNVYRNPNEQGIKKILHELKERIENNVKDIRAKELIIDAINWAYEHPLEVFDIKKSVIDAPNMVAFSQLLASINNIFKGKKVNIKKFVHDEQNEFGKSLEGMFNYIKDVGSDFRATDFITDITLSDNYKCPFEIISSNSCCGLQIIDVLLWLTKRHLDDPTLLKGNCKELADYVVKKGFITEFTEKSLKQEIVKINRDLFERPFTKEDESTSKEIYKKIENHRKIRSGAHIKLISDN